MKTAALIAVLVTFITSVANAAEEPAENPLEQVSYRIGRWESHTTAPDGEVIVETNWEWAPNKKMIFGSYLGRGKNGSFAMRMVTAWDSASKKIKTWSFDTSGSQAVGTYVGKQDGKHVWDLEFVIGGAIKSGQLIEDIEGKTFAMLADDGSPVVTWTNFKRTSAVRYPIQEIDFGTLFPSNYEHLKPLEHRVGDYVGELKLHNPKATGDLEMSVKWSLNKNFLEAYYASEKLGMQAFGITGWNPETKSIQNWIFMPDGSVGMSTEKLHSDGTSSSIGTLTGQDGTVPTENSGGQNDDGSVTVKGSADGKPSFEMTFRLRTE